MGDIALITMATQQESTFPTNATQETNKSNNEVSFLPSLIQPLKGTNYEAWIKQNPPSISILTLEQQSLLVNVITTLFKENKLKNKESRKAEMNEVKMD